VQEPTDVIVADVIGADFHSGAPNRRKQ